MEIMILSADSPEETRAQIEAGLNKISSVLGPRLGTQEAWFRAWGASCLCRCHRWRNAAACVVAGY
ncbi:hypothetical protein EDD16DRAFT_350341 [Pisolithus croceorrhizus]|nr:hypothetical protein EDD16DRAFT_350341 [Pisolithus croceorrhizus]